MAGRIVDEAFAHVKDVMAKAKGELTNTQNAPIGKDIRSKKEIATIMKKINSMPEDARNAKMDELINMSGHTGPGMDNCGLCQAIKG
jgi:hypothetical protein